MHENQRSSGLVTVTRPMLNFKQLLPQRLSSLSSLTTCSQ